MLLGLACAVGLAGALDYAIERACFRAAREPVRKGPSFSTSDLMGEPITAEDMQANWRALSDKIEDLCDG